MWVALHNGTVHECTGISFVGVTNHVFDIRLLFVGKFPFQSRRETATATSAKSRTFDNINNVRRLFVKQAIGQCKVSFTGDILFNIFGIDKTTVTQCDAELFPVEIHVFGVADGMFRFRIYIQQPFDSSSSDDMLVDDFFRIFGSDLGVKGIIRDNFHDRTFFTEAEAAYGDDFYFVGDFVLFDGF